MTRLRILAVQAGSDERGSVSVQLVLLTPMLVVLLLFVVFCGRVAATKLSINDIAHQAARAASLARTPEQGVADAESTAAHALASAGVVCQTLTTTTNTEGLRPGSTVTVTVSCEVGLADLGLLDLGGARTFESTFASPVDLYRGTAGSTADRNSGGDDG